MSIYYILTKDGNVFELDATTGITYSEASTITTHKVEDGSTVSDHVVNEPVRIMFDGVITDIKTVVSDRNKDTDSWISGILELKRNHELFTTIWREDTKETDSNSASVYRLSNCLFRYLTITQDQTKGYSKGVHSYRVNMEIEQIRIAQRAAITVDKTFALELVDKTNIKTDSSGATEGIDPDSPQSSKLFTKAARAIPGAIGDIIRLGTP